MRWDVIGWCWGCVTCLFRGCFGAAYSSACVRVTIQCGFEIRSTLSSPQTKHSGCPDLPVAPTFQRGSWECRSIPPVEHLTGSWWFSSQRSRLIHVTTWEPVRVCKSTRTSHAGEMWAEDKASWSVCVWASLKMNMNFKKNHPNYFLNICFWSYFEYCAYYFITCVCVFTYLDALIQ